MENAGNREPCACLLLPFLFTPVGSGAKWDSARRKREEKRRGLSGWILFLPPPIKSHGVWIQQRNFFYGMRFANYPKSLILLGKSFKHAIWRHFFFPANLVISCPVKISLLLRSPPFRGAILRRRRRDRKERERGLITPPQPEAKKTLLSKRTVTIILLWRRVLLRGVT